MLEGLTDIGAGNAEFARRFLQEARIALTGGSLQGTRGRRVQFWPASGRVRQMAIKQGKAQVLAAGCRAKGSPHDVGSVELF